MWAEKRQMGTMLEFITRMGNHIRQKIGEISPKITVLSCRVVLASGFGRAITYIGNFDKVYFPADFLHTSCRYVTEQGAHAKLQHDM